MQVERITTDFTTRTKPLFEKLKDFHRSSSDLGTTGEFDEQRAIESADLHADVLKRLLIEKERTKAKLLRY